MKMKQEANESPKDFHARIRHAMRLSGMAAAVTPFILQTVFEQGLQPDIRMHVESLGTAQAAVKLNRTQGYWNAHNGKGRNLLDKMPEVVKKRIQPTPSAIKTKPSVSVAPAVQANSIDQLVSEFKKMSAHVADMDRRIQARQEYGQPQYFTANPGTQGNLSRPCPNCGGAHWKSECQFT